MVIDQTSLETVWVVMHEHGIDAGASPVCFTTNEADAVRVVAELEAASKAGTPHPLDPDMKPARADDPCGYSVTAYWYETAPRWPNSGQRYDERLANRHNSLELPKERNDD